MLGRGIRRSFRLPRSLAALAFALVGIACGPARPRAPATNLPGARSVQSVLPADLDVVMWFDVNRLRDLWSVNPDLQMATILGEYGVFAVGQGGDDAAYWLQLLSHSERLWVACRPSIGGCVDTVVFARGRFADHDPTRTLSDVSPPLDLGAGWFRYDRVGKLRREQPARIYLAPPDRCVTAPLAELDAVERSLEQGKADGALQVEERGIFSMAVRPRAFAGLVAQRSPAASRFLRDARLAKLWLEANARYLELGVVVGFEQREQAERARLAFLAVASAVGLLKERDSTALPQLEVVDRDVVLRLRFAAPEVPPHPTDEGPLPHHIPEPAAE